MMVIYLNQNEKKSGSIRFYKNVTEACQRFLLRSDRARNDEYEAPAQRGMDYMRRTSVNPPCWPIS